MSQSVKCICIDDTKKPNEIPANKWVKNGDIYHITHIYKQLNQPGIQGVELAEFDISMCKPYNSYRMSRFAIDINDLEKLKSLMEKCTELDKISIDDFVKELINNDELILEES